MEKVKNKRLSERGFEATRDEVLTQWPTGREVDFKEAVAYQRSLSEKKVFTNVINQALQKGETLIQPRAGMALVEQQVKLLKYLEAEGEVDLLPTTVDSYTRQNRYEEAETGIAESKKTGRSLLNGFPIVNHGIKNGRKVTEAVGRPVQVRHGTPDARLLAEIALASGFTAFEGGGISYNIPYTKNVSLADSIRYWQYVDRLTGIYEENGIPVNREPFGPLTGTLVPPSLSHAVAVIESLLAAEQGVKNISVGYGQSGCLLQDIAAVQTLAEITREYLTGYGYGDVTISTVLHQWMGGFPADEAKAFAVINWGAVAASFSGATKVIVKTPHEAFGVPTGQANADGLKATRQTLNMLKGQTFPRSESLKEEKEVILEETRSILERVSTLGRGDWAVGTVTAFAAGVLDIPFSPSRFNRGKVMPVRDNNGAVRFLDPGNLPFPRDILDFHREKLAARAKAEKREVSFQMMIDDIYAVSKGMLVGRPR